MALDHIPKPVRRRVYALAATVYERELARELGKLASSFDEWRAARLDPFELSERIRKFHNGPSRKLYTTYTDQSMAHMHVAYGLHVGLLKPEEVPDEVRQAIGNAIAFYRALDIEGELEDTDSAE